MWSRVGFNGVSLVTEACRGSVALRTFSTKVNPSIGFRLITPPGKGCCRVLSVKKLSTQHVRSRQASPLDLKPRTTGWTEATRNQFHPCDVIAALRPRWPALSPSGEMGVTELVCHVLNEGREASRRYIDDEGRVEEYIEGIVPRAEQCEDYLRKRCLGLAKYSDALTDQKISRLLKKKNGSASLIETVEQLFGKTVTLKPLQGYYLQSIMQQVRPEKM